MSWLLDVKDRNGMYIWESYPLDLRDSKGRYFWDRLNESKFNYKYVPIFCLMLAILCLSLIIFDNRLYWPATAGAGLLILISAFVLFRLYKLKYF